MVQVTKLLLFVPRWWRLIGPAHCFETSTAPNFGVQRRDWENELAHGGAAVEKSALGLRSDTAVQTRTPSGRHTGANHRVRRWQWGNRGASPCLQHRYANRSWTLTNISRLAANVFSMPWSKKLHLRHKMYSERLFLDFNCTRYFYYDTFLGINCVFPLQNNSVTCAAAYS